MKAIVKFVEQDLKSRIARWAQWTRKTKGKFQNLDETVEAQARTFRVWMWSSALGLSVLLIAAVLSTKRDPDKSPLITSPKEAAVSMLDQLPDGYMIAPIEPTNIDSLDSIFESHGYADLYRSDAEGSRGQRIARGLALIRAPRNPRQFAVIVSESDIDVLGQLNEPVMVVLRKKPQGTTEVKSMKSQNRKSRSPFPKAPARTIDLIEEDGTDNDGGVS